MVKTEQLVNKGWPMKKMFPCKVREIPGEQDGPILHFCVVSQNTSDALHLTRLGNQTNKYRKDHFIPLILVVLFFSNVSIPSISIQINGYSGV